MNVFVLFISTVNFSRHLCAVVPSHISMHLGESTHYIQLFMWSKQALANRSPDSRFVLEAIIKALISKSSRCSILKTHNRLYLIPDSQPDSSLPDYLIFPTCTCTLYLIPKISLAHSAPTLSKLVLSKIYDWQTQRKRGKFYSQSQLDGDIYRQSLIFLSITKNLY